MSISIHNRITDEQFHYLVDTVITAIDKANPYNKVDRRTMSQQLEDLFLHYDVKVVQYLCHVCEDRGEVNDPTPCGRCGVKGCRTMECPTCKGESKDFYE